MTNLKFVVTKLLWEKIKRKNYGISCISLCTYTGNEVLKFSGYRLRILLSKISVIILIYLYEPDVNIFYSY